MGVGVGVGDGERGRGGWGWVGGGDIHYPPHVFGPLDEDTFCHGVYPGRPWFCGRVAFNEVTEGFYACPRVLPHGILSLAYGRLVIALDKSVLQHHSRRRASSDSIPPYFAWVFVFEKGKGWVGVGDFYGLAEYGGYCLMYNRLQWCLAEISEGPIPFCRCWVSGVRTQARIVKVVKRLLTAA